MAACPSKGENGNGTGAKKQVQIIIPLNAAKTRFGKQKGDFDAGCEK